MTAYEHIEVNGFRFGYLLNSSASEDGVVVLTDTDVDARGFMKALKHARFLYPYIRAEAWILEWKEYALNRTDDYVGKDCLQLVEEAIRLNIISIRPQTIAIINAWRNGVSQQK